MTPSLRAYLLENVSVLVPAGMQTIVFMWLVTVLLHESPERVGIAQMVSMLPGLLLILVAGIVGDRFDQRRILIVMHLLLALPTMGMALLVMNDALTFHNLLAMALLGGIIGTFLGPPRDAMLSRVAGGDVQKAVIMVMGLQFAAQIVGFVIASMTDRIGADVLLAAAAVMYALGAWPCLRLPRSEPDPTPRRHVVRELKEGFAVAIRDDRIWPAIVLTFALGVFFAGSFMVLLPLIIRDIYQGGAADFSLAFACNMLGTVTTIVVLFRRGGVHHQGRAFMLALLFGCVVLTLLWFHPPYWAFFVMNYVWGLSAGLTMTMGRAIVQQSAPPALGARLLSLYAFGLTAGMPIGSLMIGYIVSAFGTLEAVLVPSLGMALSVLLVHVASRFWWVTAGAPLETIVPPAARSEIPAANHPA